MREQNDELNGQILSLSLFEAKNLFATQTKAQSLAAEIDNASRDQVKPLGYIYIYFGGKYNAGNKWKKFIFSILFYFSLPFQCTYKYEQ